MNFTQICFSFKGRIGRLAWWMMYILIAIILVILEAIDPNLFDPDSLKVSYYIITLLVLVWVKLAVDTKRWHDRNKSALWILFSLIPIIGQIWMIIELGFFAGTNGQNRFGTRR